MTDGEVEFARQTSQDMLVAVGSYEGAELLEYGNRVPLGGSITPAFDSAIRWLLVETPPHTAQTQDRKAGATTAETQQGPVTGRDDR